MVKTTITLEQETRDRLKKLGNKGETWDSLINRMIDERKESELEKIRNGDY